MTQFIKNEYAVEGIPLKLIIIVLILAITIPLIWTTLVTYDRIQKENDIRNKIEIIITTIKFVYTNGEGNSEKRTIDFSSSFATMVERVEIGDKADGPFLNTIRYKLSDSPMVTVIIDNPNIPVAHKTSSGLDALELGEGEHTLQFTARSDYDFDSDGYDDLYVEVAQVR